MPTLGVDENPMLPKMQKQSMRCELEKPMMEKEMEAEVNLDVHARGGGETTKPGLGGRIEVDDGNSECGMSFLYLWALLV
jgi:hypothetical protein